MSLLSMFVLACMLVVWDKLSVHTFKKDSESLLIICDEKFKAWINPATQSFSQISGFTAHVSLLTSDEIDSSTMVESQSNFVLIRSQRNLKWKQVKQKNFYENILIGHYSPGPKRDINSSNQSEPTICMIGKGIENPSRAFAFSRFIMSPDQGHPHFEESGFSPIKGDAWEITPSLIVYATEEFRDKLSIHLADFSKREGIQIELNIRSPSSIVKTVSLVGKSEAKQYLPDVLFGFLTFTNDHELYELVPKSLIGEKAGGAFISRTSNARNAAQRLVHSAESYLRR